MSQTNWEADKMLDVYIHDYFVKRKLHASAKAFQQEGKVSSDPVAIDAPGGFLFEWWSVFWDIFIARTNEKHSEHAASYIETQMSKAREHQQLQKSQHIHIQQLMLQRQAQQQQQQQQRRDGGQLINSNTNGITSADPLIRPNTGSANALATKMYEDKLKLSQASEDIKQRFGDNVGSHLLDPNQASILKSAAVGVQHQGQALHGTPGSMPPGSMPGNLHHFQSRSPQLPLSAQDLRPEMNPMINARAGAPGGLEGSLMGISGSNQGGNNLTLRGLPLTGFDSLRPGILPTQKTMIPSSQPSQQLQLQQQLILQAQQGLAFPSMDMETKRRILYNSNRNVSLGKDGQLNIVGEVVPNIGSPIPISCPVLPRGDSIMLMKQQLPNNNPSQQQNSQNALSSQPPQIPNQLDASVSNSFRGNDQASKVQLGKKRKQPVSSSGPANSTGTANTAGLSPSSAPSTPSTHTPGEMTMPNIPHNNGTSKPSIMFGSDSVGPLASAPNQLADMSRFGDEATLDDNVESFLSQEEGDQRDTMGRGMEVSKGFTFKELALIQASASKVNCCHFSLDGKLLATGGHDKKVVLWFTDTQKPKSTLEEHTHMITDVRFSPSMRWLATSSFDRTVRVWEVENTAGYSLRNFTGHSSSVISLDFHPTDNDVICSNDSNGEIRVWNISHGSCPKVFEGGSVQVRFQPQHGKYLAAVSESVVNIIDFNTWECVEQLQGHSSKLHSVCWDFSGERLACVSEDMIRVWSVVSGGDWQCIHELNCTGNKFNTCVFHPVFSSLLIIGCYQNMELWNMVENKTMTLAAHEGQITSLATSTISSLVASASHDKCVKLWK